MTIIFSGTCICEDVYTQSSHTARPAAAVSCVLPTAYNGAGPHAVCVQNVLVAGSVCDVRAWMRVHCTARELTHWISVHWVDYGRAPGSPA